MFIAQDLLTGEKISIRSAAKQYNYVCPLCNDSLVQRRGDNRAHHFAHKSKADNAPDCILRTYRYEDVSDWHIDWQNQFPADAQETYFKEQGKEDIADVYLHEIKKIIEFRHTPLPLRVFEKRNSFFTTMQMRVIWLFDFTEQFKNSNITYRDAKTLPKEQRDQFPEDGTYAYDLDFFKKFFGNYNPERDLNVQVCFANRYEKDGETREMYRLITGVSENKLQITAKTLHGAEGFKKLCYKKEHYYTTAELYEIRKMQAKKQAEKREEQWRKSSEEYRKKLKDHECILEEQRNERGRQSELEEQFKRELAPIVYEIVKAECDNKPPTERMRVTWDQLKGHRDFSPEVIGWTMLHPDKPEGILNQLFSNTVNAYIKETLQNTNRLCEKAKAEIFGEVRVGAGETLESVLERATNAAYTERVLKLAVSEGITHLDNTICEKAYKELMKELINKLREEYNHRPFVCIKCGTIGTVAEFKTTKADHTGTCKACYKETPPGDVQPKETLLGKCPKCNSPVRIKKNKRTGQSFIGCTSWPNCNYTKNI